MTLIDPSRISRSVPAPNNHYHIVDNTTILTDSALSAVNDQLSRKIEELGNFHQQELCQLKNLIKDQNQEISGLKKLIQEILEKPNKNSSTTSNVPIKNNIIFDFKNSSTHNLVYRVHGFYNQSDYGAEGCAREKQVMIEFKSNFPKKFTLDIKGNCEVNSESLFEIHIGKLDEKRHKKEFQLFTYGTRDYATILFETEDEENNTIWVDIPEYLCGNRRHAGLKIYSLNIIPR